GGKCFNHRPGRGRVVKWYVRIIGGDGGASQPDTDGESGESGESVAPSAHFSANGQSRDEPLIEKRTAEGTDSPHSPDSPSVSGSPPDGRTWQLVAHPADIAVVLLAIDESTVVGVDVETTGLSPLKDRIRLIQLATDRAIFLIDLFEVYEVSAL